MGTVLGTGSSNQAEGRGQMEQGGSGAQLGNAVSPPIALGRNTLGWAWGESGRTGQETQPGRWGCPHQAVSVTYFSGCGGQVPS